MYVFLRSTFQGLLLIRTTRIDYDKPARSIITTQENVQNVSISNQTLETQSSKSSTTDSNAIFGFSKTLTPEFAPLERCNNPMSVGHRTRFALPV